MTILTLLTSEFRKTLKLPALWVGLGALLFSLLLVGITVIAIVGLTTLSRSLFFGRVDAAGLNLAGLLPAILRIFLSSLSYLAFMLMVTVFTRSTFAGIVIGLGYTQLVEFLLTGVFHGAGWSKLLVRNLHLSATYLLNSIGNRSVALPGYLLVPLKACNTAAVYTLVFLSAAIWLYRRQDVGG